MKSLNKELSRLLDRRGLNVTLLADRIFAGRCALNRVLNGRRIGRQTWPKLRKVLTDEEFQCAINYAAGELAREWLEQNPPIPDVEPRIGERELREYILGGINARGEQILRLPAVEKFSFAK